MENRVVFIDNVKGILIFLVVLGHFTNWNFTYPVIGALNDCIYSFHMPMFVFISGYLSKRIYSQRRTEITTILYPYFLFQVLHYSFNRVTGLGIENPNLFIPTYENWYLMGLFIWRSFIPYARLFKRIYVFIAVTALALGIGFYDEFYIFLGLYRVLCFRPISPSAFKTSSKISGISERS